mgnify:CR=1 FL=1
MKRRTPAASWPSIPPPGAREPPRGERFAAAGSPALEGRAGAELFAEGLTPINRWGQPSDIGKAVVAVTRGLLPYSTGQVLNVDGGFHLRVL